MKVNQAEFVISNTDVRLCPAPDKPEYAFIGDQMLANHL